MKHQRIVIVGLGGIGSQMLPSLLHYLTSIRFQGEVVLVDGDMYELKNLNRQLVPEQGVGLNKADALAEAWQHLPLALTPIPEYIDPENIDLLVREGDLVICGVDNHYTRRLIDEYITRLLNVTFVSGGNDLTDGNAQIVRRRNGKALDPRLTQVHPEIAEAVEPPDFTPGCDRMVNAAPQIIVTNLMVACTMLNAVWAIMEEREIPYSEVYVDVELNAARSRKRDVVAA